VVGVALSVFPVFMEPLLAEKSARPFLLVLTRWVCLRSLATFFCLLQEVLLCLLKLTVSPEGPFVVVLFG
jgi:hypothetical protein